MANPFRRAPVLPAVLLPLFAAAAALSAPPAREDRPPEPGASRTSRGEHGMVVSDAPLASATGAGVLRRGGNAVDAAVATAFALAVVYPEAGNLGGGGFMVAHFAAGRRDGVAGAVALDFRETAPAAATRDMFLDAAGSPTDRSLTGALAAGVPGTVAGLWEAHRRCGALAWSELVSPAIALADTGYFVSAEWRRAALADSARLARFPGTKRLFLPEGRVPAAGERWRNPELAATLRRIAERGAEGFYQGETAALLAEEMARGGGIITLDDLRGYRPRWRDPVEFRYRGHTVVSMPPPSSGGLTLALMARLLEPWDLGAMGRATPDAVHLVAEAMRRAFAVRNRSLGDPDFIPCPPGEILSERRIAALRASIRMERATPSGEIAGLLDSLDAAKGAPGMPAEGRHTTHFSVADREGNAVALTTTLNDNFGSLVAVSGAGFLLNNEMDDFTARPGSPNLYGLVQGEANAVAPGKRMLSSMAPTIVLDAGGRVRLVTGASGGPTIISAVFQVVSNLLDFGAGIGEAVDAPRFHHQQYPDEIRVEPGGFAPAVVEALAARGHRVVEARAGTHPTPVADSILRREGAWWGHADPRDGGSAEGF